LLKPGRDEDSVPSFCIALISGFLWAVKDIYNDAVACRSG
jgi:hypothetical protein